MLFSRERPVEYSFLKPPGNAVVFRHLTNPIKKLIAVCTPVAATLSLQHVYFGLNKCSVILLVEGDGGRETGEKVAGVEGGSKQDSQGGGKRKK